jgi:nucleoside-diphosphate kinase
MIQKTLVILKPDAVKRNIVWELITRFEKVWLHLVGLKMVWVDENLAFAHYEKIGTLVSRRWEDVYRVNADFMMSGPVVAIVLEGIESIPTVRKMVWSTSPKDALPGTIRWDYSHMSREYANQQNWWLPNLIHASATPEEAEQEIALWFAGNELYDHEMESHLYKRWHK